MPPHSAVKTGAGHESHAAAPAGSHEKASSHSAQAEKPVVAHEKKHGATVDGHPAAGHAAAAHDAGHDAHIAHLAHSIAMYSSVGVAGAGIFLAFVVYWFGWINPEKMEMRFKPVHTFLVNKWYFDELYEATFIGGTKALSRALGWFDLHVVDGLVNLIAQMGVWVSWLVGKFDNAVVDGAVNGVATVTIESGSFFRRFQTGKLYHYVFVLAGGVLIIYLVKAF
jgi:NADH-quinone oxidoreductase subunit L